MKKIILSLIATVFMFGGCAAMDATYGKAKGVYKAGKVVYEVQPLKSNTVEALGTTAEAYDGLRSEVRGK